MSCITIAKTMLSAVANAAAPAKSNSVSFQVMSAIAWLKPQPAGYVGWGFRTGPTSGRRDDGAPIRTNATVAAKAKKCARPGFNQNVADRPRSQLCCRARCSASFVTLIPRSPSGPRR
jgi:hypothetical protein